jgi:tRNA nucleotidyltransferase (CCA-adding enzyme)
VKEQWEGEGRKEWEAAVPAPPTKEKKPKAEKVDKGEKRKR